MLLIDAQIDHCTGLLMLRERSAPLPLYATPEVLDDIGSGFPLTRLLGHYCGLQTRPIALDGQPLDLPFLEPLQVHAVPIASQPPPYSPFRGQARAGDNIALMIRNPLSGRSLFYAPGLGRIDAATRELMEQADLLLDWAASWPRWINCSLSALTRWSTHLKSANPRVARVVVSAVGMAEAASHAICTEACCRTCQPPRAASLDASSRG